MSKKRIHATLYMESKINKNTFSAERNPAGFLFANGKYHTKILPEDLPEYFVYGYLYKRYGYISANGVKHLLYVPNYAFTNHLHKDDTLFVSYNAQIEPCVTESGFHWYRGYDELFGGHLIEKFVNAAEKYSHYDSSVLKEEIRRKRAWYHEQNGQNH
jgi:hypothetical protein